MLLCAISLSTDAARRTPTAWRSSQLGESTCSPDARKALLHVLAQDLFQAYFALPTDERPGEPSVLRLTWHLFIVAKAKLLPPFPDLVSSFNLLVCVLAFVFSHVPAAQRAVDLADAEKLPVRDAAGAVDVLQVRRSFCCARSGRATMDGGAVPGCCACCYAMHAWSRAQRPARRTMWRAQYMLKALLFGKGRDARAAVCAVCAQSFAAYNKANPKEVVPLMARLDTMLRSLLADYLTDNAGAHALLARLNFSLCLSTPPCSGNPCPCARQRACCAAARVPTGAHEARGAVRELRTKRLPGCARRERAAPGGGRAGDGLQALPGAARKRGGAGDRHGRAGRELRGGLQRRVRDGRAPLHRRPPRRRRRVDAGAGQRVGRAALADQVPSGHARARPQVRLD